MTFGGPELCAKSALEVVGLLRAGEVSPGEVLEAVLARVAQVEPAVNALPTLCAARARAAAGAIDRATPLAGLPLPIKDLTPVAGVRTTWGTPALADHVPEASDPLVTHLEGQGAVIYAKSNTPEMGAGGNTFNAVFGPTRNAWDTRLNAGGSSGGAAVALACGAAWLAHGSDHGGSLRTPAAYNGVVGLRPSPGRVVSGPGEAGFLMEGVQGPMARSVSDLALLLDAMAGFDPVSPLSFPSAPGEFSAAAARPATRPRIAFAPDLGGFAPVEPDIAAALARAMAGLERAGAQVVETCPDLPGLARSYHTLRGIMWATMARRLPARVRAGFKPELEENIRFGEALSMGDITDAQLDRSTIYANMLNLFKDFDVLALPVTGTMPHPVEEEWVHEVAGQRLSHYMDWLRFAFLATVAGLPAMSVPVGSGPGGLPVGLQLIGPPRGEARLIAVARMVEITMGGPLAPIDPDTARKDAGKTDV